MSTINLYASAPAKPITTFEERFERNDIIGSNTLLLILKKLLPFVKLQILNQKRNLKSIKYYLF